MKTLLWFLLFVTAFSLYAEFIISRPVNNLITIAATAVIVVLFVFFMKSFIQFIIQKLKL